MVEKKRIAFVIASDILGGHEFQSVALALEISSYHDVVVLLNRPHLLPLFENAQLSCEVHEGLFLNSGFIGAQIARGVAKNRSVARVLGKYDRVIVCAGAVEASVVSGLACLLNGINAVLYIPFFYDRQIIWGELGVFYNLLLRILLNVYPQLITINAIQARIMGFLYRGEVSVVGNLIDGVPPLLLEVGKPRLVFIGRLDRQKGILELIKAVDFIENPYEQLLIIGDGPLRADVLHAIRGAKYIEIEYLGWLDTQAQSEVLRASDVLVLNSIVEGEPMVLREAAERGMIAVVPDIPGIRGVTYRSLRFKNIKELRSLLTSTVINEIQKNQSRRKFRAYVNRRRQIEKIFG